MEGLSTLSNRNTENPNSDEATANAVLREYDIPLPDIASAITLIQGGTIKTVWKVKTAAGPLCLKRLKQTYDKALFSVNAQKYIYDSGGNVPEIIPNRSNQLITSYKDELFVLYEWVAGTDLNFSNPADLRRAMHGLARFHIHSKGYSPDKNSRTSTKLGKWPEQYDSMLNKLAAWKKTAAANTAQPFFPAYLKYTDSMADTGKMAVEALKISGYGILTAEGSNSIVLCHQDYGKGNALLTEKGVTVLDLDGVTFDLPARDLRKIIGKNAENKNQWQAEAIEEIIGWYEEVNPLSRDEKEALFADLLFPHWYYGLVKNPFQNGKPVRPAEIERIAKLEESKIQILKALMKRSE